MAGPVADEPWKYEPYAQLKSLQTDPWETLKRGGNRFGDETGKAWKEDLGALLVFVR